MCASTQTRLIAIGIRCLFLAFLNLLYFLENTQNGSDYLSWLCNCAICGNGAVLCNGQTQFNSKGDWTEFKDIGESIQARVKCGQGGPDHGMYVIQFKNINANDITMAWRATGSLFAGPRWKLTVEGRSVTKIKRLSKLICGNRGSQDIFVSAIPPLP